MAALALELCDALHGAPLRRVVSMQFRDALMIALACYHAPRLRNLAEMRIGEHLCRVSDGTWRLECLNTKTGAHLSPRLASSLVKPLELYLARHRPSLLAEGEDQGFLRISLRGSQLAPNAIRAVFQRTGSTLIGQPLHPHQVRHGMAWQPAC